MIAIIKNFFEFFCKFENKTFDWNICFKKSYKNFQRFQLFPAITFSLDVEWNGSWNIFNKFSFWIFFITVFFDSQEFCFLHRKLRWRSFCDFWPVSYFSAWKSNYVIWHTKSPEGYKCLLKAFWKCFCDRNKWIIFSWQSFSKI